MLITELSITDIATFPKKYCNDFQDTRILINHFSFVEICNNSMALQTKEKKILGQMSDKQCRGGVESNRTNLELIFIEFFRNIFHLSNQSNHKFSNRIERISNKSSIWKIWLHPIVGVDSNEFRINFHRIANYRI